MPFVLAVLLLVAALLPAASAEARQPPARNGAVAFLGHNAGDPVLFVRRGGRTVGVLRGEGVADPAWSPLGRRLAVTRETAGEGRAVWILNPDGTGLRRLTDLALAGAAPSWSPNGRRLAYAAGAVGARTLHVVSTDGTGDRALTAPAGDQHDPAWSSRDMIAFVASTPTGDDVFTVPVRGGVPRRLTVKPGHDTDPAWSPRGTQIAFVRGTGGIWTMSRFGRGKRKVVHVPGGIEQGIAWSPDGTRLVFAGGPAGRRQIYSVKLNGKGLRTLSLPTSDGEDPSWQPTGFFPVIGAAGDMACPPTGKSFNGGLGTPERCASLRTSNLLLQRDLWAVLALGDIQPPYGELPFYYQAFGPTWGRLNSIMRPVPGNHDYGNYRGTNEHAEGYFDYFAAAGVFTGDRARGGYYSFDIGDWHLIALDSNCNNVPGGCSIGSPQQRWLERDLRRNAKHCTLAFWHHPRYSSVAVEGRGPKQTVDLWRTLHDAGADLVLNGHQHFYERLAPQDADGNLDRVHGIRTFVVGTGGHSLDQAEFRDRNSQAFSADSFGILQLTLRPKGFDYRFVSAGPVEFFDSGHAPCH